jgi:Zn-dependent peptidase ImmA (M78 family)
MFSGALVPIGTGAVIVENDSHPSVRRRSTLGHELAHVFGEHKFATSLVNERGCRPDARG